MSVPRSSPFDCSISWSIFFIVFCIVCTSTSDNLLAACSFNSNTFCKRSFSACKRNWVFRASEFLNKSNSDCANACCWSNIINCACKYSSAIALPLTSNPALITPASCCCPVGFCSFCNNAVCLSFSNNCIRNCRSCSLPCLTACKRNSMLSFCNANSCNCRSCSIFNNASVCCCSNAVIVAFIACRPVSFKSFSVCNWYCKSSICREY